MPTSEEKHKKKSKSRKHKRKLEAIREDAEFPYENESEFYKQYSRPVNLHEFDVEPMRSNTEINISQEIILEIEEQPRSSVLPKINLESNLNHSIGQLSDISSPARSLLSNSVRSSRRLYTIDGKEIQINPTTTPFNGEAKYKWPDKSIYEGQWTNNKMHGQGVLCWPDGRIYKGEFVNGIREGYGVMTWANGQVYEGFWKAGKQNGEGTLTIKGKSSPIIIKGIWVNGMRGEATYNKS